MKAASAWSSNCTCIAYSCCERRGRRPAHPRKEDGVLDAQRLGQRRDDRHGGDGLHFFEFAEWTMVVLLIWRRSAWGKRGAFSR